MQSHRTCSMMMISIFIHSLPLEYSDCTSALKQSHRSEVTFPPPSSLHPLRSALERVGGSERCHLPHSLIHPSREMVITMRRQPQSQMGNLCSALATHPLTHYYYSSLALWIPLRLYVSMSSAYPCGAKATLAIWPLIECSYYNTPHCTQSSTFPLNLTH